MEIFSCKKPRYNRKTGRWELEAVHALNEQPTIKSFDTKEELETFINNMVDGLQDRHRATVGEITKYV